MSAFVPVRFATDGAVRLTRDVDLDEVQLPRGVRIYLDGHMLRGTDLALLEMQGSGATAFIVLAPAGGASNAD